MNNNLLTNLENQATDAVLREAIAKLRLAIEAIAGSCDLADWEVMAMFNDRFEQGKI